MKVNDINNANQLTLPEGLSLRPARLEDVHDLTELINLISRNAIGEDELEESLVRTELNSPGFDLQKDSLLVSNPQGQLIAYEMVFADQPVPVHPQIWGGVHPDYMGLGIATALLNWAIERGRHVLDTVPPDTRVSLFCEQNAKWEPGKQLLQDFGMDVARHFFEMEIMMNEKPPEPQWAEGISVQVYQHPEEIEAVYHAKEETFLDHFGFMPEPFEKGFERFKHFYIDDEAFTPELWFLAKDGSEIAGMALNRIHSMDNREDTGHVRILGVRRPWRKRGLGLALLQHSFRKFWELGKKRVTLGVDANSITNALKLYEKAGMSVYHQFTLYELPLREGKELTRIS